jgi:protease I
MSKKLAGRRVAVLAADGVDQGELVEPRRAVEDAGATTELLSIKESEVHAVSQDVGLVGTFTVDKLVRHANPDDYDALILPGADPEHLRTDASAMSFVRSFVDSGKPVGVICRGPSALVETGVMRGRMLTSYPSNPNDLPSFCHQIVTEFA